MRTNEKRRKGTGGGRYESIAMSPAENTMLEIVDNTPFGLQQSDFDDNNEIVVVMEEDNDLIEEEMDI